MRFSERTSDTRLLNNHPPRQFMLLNGASLPIRTPVRKRNGKRGSTDQRVWSSSRRAKIDRYTRRRTVLTTSTYTKNLGDFGKMKSNQAAIYAAAYLLAHALAACAGRLHTWGTRPSSLRRFIACRRLEHVNQAFVRRDKFDHTIRYSSKKNAPLLASSTLGPQKKGKIKPTTPGLPPSQ
ncbi:hypothetical protein LI328DRAFT_159752 [Trichoderma asperelloides]|nr:hypothetical protein LI328DRAFT_159752 [Trichoderma asperelloides]